MCVYLWTETRQIVKVKYFVLREAVLKGKKKVHPEGIFFKFWKLELTGNKLQENMKFVLVQSHRTPISISFQGQAQVESKGIPLIAC